MTTKRIEAFIRASLRLAAKPKKKGKAPTPLNRDLAALRGALDLARKQD